MPSPRPTTTLWRPTGPVELELVREREWRAWPPRLPEQPIFYPVLNEDYAIRIARDLERQARRRRFRHPLRGRQRVPRPLPGPAGRGETILELWVPAEELDEFNAHIVGRIEVVHEFRGAAEPA